MRWLAVVIGLAAGIGMLGYLRWAEREPELPVLIQLPDFEFSDQRDRTIRGADLDGRVWIANFIFTSCPSACPALTRRMKEVSDALPQSDDLRFVSFSVDPETDTPSVLHAYAERHGADHERWLFLTGEADAVTETVVQGFRLHVGERVQQPESTVYDIMHALRFVLVDGERRIRGYYQSDDEGIAALRHDTARLLD